MSLKMLGSVITQVVADRPGGRRTAEYPLLSIEAALGSAFVLYPALVLGLRALLAGSTYSVDAAWLRYLAACHNGVLFAFSLLMWVSVLFRLSTESPWGSAVEFFCLPNGKPEMPARLVLFNYLFYLSKIYELLDTVILVLKRKEIIFLHV